jgi:cytochrome c biogenesis protein CcdA
MSSGHVGLSGEHNVGKHKQKKRYHDYGCLSSLGTFVVYIIFGLGLFAFLQEKSTAAMFRFVLAAILAILGLMQLEDARRLQSGGASLFRVDWTKKYVRGVISSRKLTAYFLLGALFSLVRAPCVGSMYVAIIGAISGQESASSGLFYLLVFGPVASCAVPGA